jgi:hypothetical protein
MAARLPARPTFAEHRAPDAAGASTTRHSDIASGLRAYAGLLARRFEVACQRAGSAPRRNLELDTTQFRPPSPGGQLELWGQSEP